MSTFVNQEYLSHILTLPQTQAEERAPRWVTLNKMYCKETTATARVNHLTASSVYQWTENGLFYIGMCKRLGTIECVAFARPFLQ